MSTPRSIFSRASVEKRTSLAAMGSILFVASQPQGAPDGQPQRAGFVRSGEACVLRDDAEDVGFLHDQEVLPVDLALGAGPLAEQDAVAGLDVERVDAAALV